MVSKPAHVVVPAVALFAFAAFCWVRSAHAQSENARARWEYATVEALTEYSQGNALLSIANICYHTSDGCRWDTLRVWVDRTGRALDRNAQAASMLGLGLREGSSALDFALPEAGHIVRENLEAAFEGEVRRFEIPFVRADGTRRTASIPSTAAGSGKPQCAVIG